jgi:hypothetical protein
VLGVVVVERAVVRRLHEAVGKGVSVLILQLLLEVSILPLELLD